MAIIARTALVVVLSIVLAACATVQASKARDTNVAAYRSFYVQKLPADERGIEQLIFQRLNAMGYKATVGRGETPPESVDAIVTYQDRWMWDITMYLLKLNVQLRDPKTGVVLAAAESYRPSLERRTPEEMVEEVLIALFKQ